LEFTDKDRFDRILPGKHGALSRLLSESDQTFVSGEHVITQWTLQVTITEPFYGWTHQKDPYFDT